MKIAVCDNDSDFLEQLARIIRSWIERHGSGAVECFSTGASLMKAHAKHSFDIIVLEPAMARQSGMKVARKIRASDSAVKLVFVSRSGKHALESYSVKASNYLLKPVDEESLFQTLEDLTAEKKNSSPTIFLKGIHVKRRLLSCDIECITSRGKYADVILVGGDIVVSNEPFHVLEERLVKCGGFIRCHRCHIVNIGHVSSFSQGKVRMQSGRELPVSRSIRVNFREMCGISKGDD